ncbi:MBL fold metallo-hydrolase [Chlamydiota bacterium]
MIHRIVVGPIETNCYVVFDNEKKGVVIDPGAEPNKIRSFIEQKAISVISIINTHAHYDHIGANADLQKLWNVPVLIRSEDAPMFHLDWSRVFGVPLKIEPPKTVELVDDKAKIMVNTLEFQIIHTPGHSPGGISLYLTNDDVLFSGDTLFCDGIGRTDFVNGSYPLIKKSLDTLFSIFPDTTRVLPGHGPETTIGRERRHEW